ncbi:MAG: hypothetical protein ACRDWE_03780 [Acidimicrobiales bacterium]
MRLPNFSKKAVALAAAVGIVLGTGGIAAAYFTTTGTGHATVTVGTTTTKTDWTVTLTGSPTFMGATTKTATKIYSGGYERRPLKITNVAASYEGLKIVKVTLNTIATSSTTLVVTTAGAKIAGCLATWWTVTLRTAAGTTTEATYTATTHTAKYTLATVKTMAPTAIATYVVELMLKHTDVTQIACENAVPKFTVTAS